MERKIEMKEENNLPRRVSTTRMLTESALLVAVATVLSLFAVFRLQNGGSVTIGSMIPIVLISLKYRFGWALLTALAYSLIQMITGFFAPPVENLLYYTLMILLDYVLAFSVLCLAGPIYRVLNVKLPDRVRMMTGAIICFVLRFFCHFFSGIIIWGTYAPKGQPVWLYSLLYNGSYMLLECLISGVVIFVAGQMLASVFIGEKRKAKESS